MIFASLGAVFVYAADPGNPVTGGGNPVTGGGNPVTGGGNPPTGGGNPVNLGITLDNPFKSGDSLTGLLDNIFNGIVFPIGGILAVLAFIYSGFLYVTAQGNESKIKTAHTALLYTAIGTAVLLGARVISEVIGGTIDQLK